MELEIEITSNIFSGSIKKKDIGTKDIPINRFVTGTISSESFREPLDFVIESYGNMFEVYISNIYDDDTFYIKKCPEDLEELTYFLESLNYKGF